MENLPLNEIKGSKGAKEASRDVGRKRLGIQFDSFDDWLFIYLVFCYSLLFAFIAPLGRNALWERSKLMRMECIIGQMCDETILLESTSQSYSCQEENNVQ